MIEEIERPMGNFGEKRKIRIYKPDGLVNQTDIRLPVLYMHDGQNLFYDTDATYGVSWGMREALYETKLPMIVVGIDCNHEGHRRFDEYSPFVNKDIGMQLYALDQPLGGQGDVYVDWLVRELKPWIDLHYPTNPEHTIIAGSSMGGLISLYAAIRHPHVFRRVGAISNAFWFCQDQLEELVRTSEFPAIERLYMDIGTKEATGPFGNASYISSNQRIYDLLKMKLSTNQLRFEIVEDGIHNEQSWRERLPNILRDLYSLTWK